MDGLWDLLQVRLNMVVFSAVFKVVAKYCTCLLYTSQTRYGTGIGGVKDDNSSRSWGPKLTEARYLSLIHI